MQEFLAQEQLTAKVVVDSAKNTHGPDQALALARQASKIVSMKGAKVIELDLHSQPEEATILACLLGPTGNLRAPTAWIGSTLVVGFHPDVYRKLLRQ